MSGCLLTSDAVGREVLTVNVNQINQDLIRQVNTVLSQHTSDIGQPNPPASSAAAAATPMAGATTSYGGPSSQPSIGIGVGSSSQNFGGHQSQGSIGPNAIGGSGGGGGGSTNAGLAPISLPSLSSRR